MSMLVRETSRFAYQVRVSLLLSLTRRNSSSSLASNDIRDLIKTVNGLPKDFRGRCSVVLNNSDPITINRSLVVLFVLLNPGTSIDESAELATHFLYSAFLTAPMAAYLQQSVQHIYSSQHEGAISFRANIPTRGRGKIFSLQTLVGVKPAMEMFQSSFSIFEGLKSIRKYFSSPEMVDRLDHFFSKLIPSHRAAYRRFHETGVLAPFSLSTEAFIHPNRLLFSSTGEWLEMETLNPLQGWDATAVQATGTLKRGVDSADIIGCLFFHVKAQLREFIRRIQCFNVDIYTTQFEPKILSAGLLAGVLPAFPCGGGCFDRIYVGDLMDHIGVQECLQDWAPLLNNGNEHATLLMYSKAWHVGRSNATALSDPHLAMMVLMDKFSHVGKQAKLKDIFSRGLRSPTLLKLLESLDAFYDHDPMFHQFLQDHCAHEEAASFGLRLRERNQIHPKVRPGLLLVKEHDTDSELSALVSHLTHLIIIFQT
ncbi:hypothetical protein VKT23_000637 [Stygiomarasmius scandens]|uniref:DUF4470 domain-containing protein n=1 Tax=Marasmiellus scandens TaxID=2682957 RepID=A0ABR1K5V6_9AGAR